MNEHMMSRVTCWRIGIVLSVVMANSGHAQTRFEWPAQQTDVATYKLLDQCLGVANRVRDSVNGVGVMRDTLSRKQSGPFAVLNQVVVNSAHRCIASIPLSSVAIENTLLAQQVLLIANRDADVVPLYRKRLDAASTDTGKIAAITSTVRLLTDVAPVRLPLADSLLADIQRYDAQWITKDKLDVLGKLCTLSDISRNDLLVTKYCKRWLSTVDSMTDAEHARYGPPLGFAYAGFTRYIRRSEMQDSLAKSSSAYVGIAREILTKAFRGWSGNQALGEKTVPIVGDFWFPESAKASAYPRPGKVTLVISVSMGANVGGNQFGSLARLKRLAAKFPDLDIVALTGTAGHFGPIAPPTPAQEASLNYRRVTEVYKVPLVMAVTISPTWRLTDPDRRRIFDPYPHDEAYEKVYSSVISAEHSPVRSTGWFNGGSDGASGLLVDADGIIVDYIQSEEELETNIAILMKRGQK